MQDHIPDPSKFVSTEPEKVESPADTLAGNPETGESFLPGPSGLTISQERKLVARPFELIAQLGKDIDKKLAKLEKKFDKLEKRFDRKLEEEPPAPPIFDNLAVDKTSPGIRSAVDAILGKEVQVREESTPDSPGFMLHLTIPQSLSKSVIQPDVRSKSFTVGQGLPAIKDWLQKVRANIFQSFQRAGEPVKLP